MKRASNYLAIVGVVLTVGLGMCLFLQFLDVATAHSFTCDVPTGMHPTIQSAVVDDSCDLINLTAPVYLENITITRSVTIQGQGYMTTTVDGGGNGRVVTIQPGSVVTLTNLTITNGVALPSEVYGGGIYNEGSYLILQNSRVSGNSALAGAGIHNEGNLTVISTTISLNVATFHQGGGIRNANGVVTIIDSQIVNNFADDTGGSGIWNGGVMIITSSSISSNRTMLGEGAGVFNYSTGIMTITHSIIKSNLNYFGTWGGGIVNSGVLWLTQSTVSDNDVNNGAVGSGGGLFNSGELVAENSTFSNNFSNFRGGGIANSGLLTVSNSTITDNLANDSGGIFNSNVVYLRNTIIANSLTGSDCGGWVSPISLGHNIASDDSCNLIGPGDMPNIDPLLGTLQGNGGNTWTHALLTGSPAIDAGDNVACPATDQRGGIRPVDGDGDNDPVCDIGAYEWGALQLTAVPDLITTTQNTPVIIDVLANDIPGDNGDPVLAGVAEPGSGTAVITDTFILYTPDLDFTGTDTFTYTITDGVVTDTAVVTVTVLPLIAPTAVDDAAETNQNEPILIDVLANDLPGSSGDPVLDSVGQPGNDTAVITGSLILYTPTPDFVGTDTFTYTITDGVLTDTAVVTVTVLPVDTQTFIYLPVVLKP